MPAIAGRTLVNVTLFRVILKESGVDPDKVQVAQFAYDQVGEMVRDSSVDAFMTVGPLDSKLTIDAIVCGGLVIRLLRAMTVSSQSRMRAKPATPPH